MTCHWLCKDKVRVKCELSPPPVRAENGTNGDSFFDEDGEEVEDGDSTEEENSLECKTPTPQTTHFNANGRLTPTPEPMVNLVIFIIRYLSC